MPLPDLFHSPLIVDYMFQKDRIFATVNLDNNELELYNTVWDVLEPKIIPPDLIVYLQASTDRLLKRIMKRDRHYEKNISREYRQYPCHQTNDRECGHGCFQELFLLVSRHTFFSCLQ